MVRFESKLNAESTKQLNKFSFRKLWWLMLLFSVFCIGFGLIGYFCAEDNSDKVLGIFFMVLGVIFAPLVWLLTTVLQKSLNKSATYITDNTDEVYEFDEEKIHIQQKSDKFQSDSVYKYEYFYKVFETKTHYFVYISKMQCHIIPKNSIVEGTVEELNELLKRYLGKKFKSKR